MKRVNKRTRVIEGSDHSFNIALIASIQNEPVLYDFRISDYSSKDKHNDAWQRLAIKHDESVKNLRDRWKNLRAGLTRHIKHLLIAEKEEGAKRNIKPYYMLEQMKFLIPFTRVDKPSNKEFKAAPEGSTLCVSECYEVPECSEGNSNPDDIYDAEIVYEHQSGEDVKQEDNESEEIDDSIDITMEDGLPTDNAFDDEESEVEEEKQEVEDLIEDEKLAKRIKLTTEKKEVYVVSHQPSTSSKKPTEKPVAKHTSENAPNFDETPEWSFFRSLMPDILTMTPAQRRKMRMGIMSVVDEILNE